MLRPSYPALSHVVVDVHAIFTKHRVEDTHSERPALAPAPHALPEVLQAEFMMASQDQYWRYANWDFELLNTPLVLNIVLKPAVVMAHCYLQAQIDAQG